MATAVRLAARKRRRDPRTGHDLGAVDQPDRRAGCPTQEEIAQSIIEEAKVQAGRRVSGHWEKVRAGQTGRRIVDEARAMHAEAIVMPMATDGSGLRPGAGDGLARAPLPGDHRVLPAKRPTGAAPRGRIAASALQADEPARSLITARRGRGSRWCWPRGRDRRAAGRRPRPRGSGASTCWRCSRSRSARGRGRRRSRPRVLERADAQLLLHHAAPPARRSPTRRTWWSCRAADRGGRRRAAGDARPPAGRRGREPRAGRLRARARGDAARRRRLGDPRRAQRRGAAAEHRRPDRRRPTGASPGADRARAGPVARNPDEVSIALRPRARAPGCTVGRQQPGRWRELERLAEPLGPADRRRGRARAGRRARRRDRGRAAGRRRPDRDPARDLARPALAADRDHHRGLGAAQRRRSPRRSAPSCST